MQAKALVIGSGIAGLASALRLRSKGYKVEVFEANSYPGGKLHSFQSEGFRFDYGPSLFTMPHFVTELFELFGEDANSHFEYRRKEIICNYFWDDGSTFSSNADSKTFAKQAAESFQEKEEHIAKYLSKSAYKYQHTSHVFLEKSLHKVNTYLSKGTLKSILSLHKLDLLSSLNDLNQKSFQNPKLVQLFNRFATYNGSNPFRTPGIMSLIPHLEMHFGTFYPKGGMYSITECLFELAKTKGITFHFNERVTEVLHNQEGAHGIDTEKSSYEGDLVVCNMDVFSAYKSILRKAKQPKRILKQERSSSALIFYWGISKKFSQLDLHNVFFTNDYQQEFAHLFEKKDLYEDPTVYINITSKEDPEHAPEGKENWFVMINAPANVGQDWEAMKYAARVQILKKLSHILGEAVEPLIETETVVDPVRIELETQSHQGSLYGTSSNSQFAAFLRHPNFSSSIKNLYFCGGSAHPGGGIPLCLLSAKIVADLVPSI